MDTSRLIRRSKWEAYFLAATSTGKPLSQIMSADGRTPREYHVALRAWYWWKRWNAVGRPPRPRRKDRGKKRRRREPPPPPEPETPPGDVFSI